MRNGKGLVLLGFGAVVAGAAWMGSRSGPRNCRDRLWYERLEKPAFTPPNAIFPVVWTTLYALIAISGWRVWQQSDSPERPEALRLWISQLISNAQWTKLFFKKHLPTWSLADVLSLETIVIRYILEARKVDKAAARLFVPYAGWVAFAALLNEEIVRRNPETAEMLPKVA